MGISFLLDGCCKSSLPNAGGKSILPNGGGKSILPNGGGKSILLNGGGKSISGPSFFTISNGGSISKIFSVMRLCLSVKVPKYQQEPLPAMASLSITRKFFEVGLFPELFFKFTGRFGEVAVAPVDLAPAEDK